MIEITIQMRADKYESKDKDPTCKTDTETGLETSPITRVHIDGNAVLVMRH